MSLPPRRVLLHIGSPKCGSTYLQRVMLRNAATLETAGVRYPHDGGRHPGNAGYIDNLDREGFAALFAGGIHTLVISHEDLFATPGRGATLARLCAEDAVTLQIVVFLRPFSEMVFGDYSQHMKQFFDHYLTTRKPYDGRDFEGFVQARRRVLTPAAFLTRWQALVPDRPLVLAHHRQIRAVVEAQLDGLPAIDWQVPPSETNPSLRMDDCDLLAALMRDPGTPDSEVRAQFRAAFRRTGEADAGRSAARAAWVEAQFAEEARALLDRFGFDNRPMPVRSVA